LEDYWKKKRSVMNHYDTIAHIYDLQYGQEQRLKIEFSLENLNLKSESLILDVGCGTGLLFDYVLGNILVGVDVSKGILMRAKGKIGGRENVFLVQADADYLPFHDGIFDVVFAITLLQNVPSPIETLKEIGRVAKKDAVIVVTGLKKKFGFKDFEKLLSRLFFLEKLWDRCELHDYVAFLSKRVPRS